MFKHTRFKLYQKGNVSLFSLSLIIKEACNNVWHPINTLHVGQDLHLYEFNQTKYSLL